MDLPSFLAGVRGWGKRGGWHCPWRSKNSQGLQDYGQGLSLLREKGGGVRLGISELRRSIVYLWGKMWPGQREGCESHRGEMIWDSLALGLAPG